MEQSLLWALNSLIESGKGEVEYYFRLRGSYQCY